MRVRDGYKNTDISDLFRVRQCLYNAVWCCAFNDVYDPADFKEWSTLLKAARSVSKKTKDYPQSDLESYLEQWRAAIDELNALADKYPLPSGITEETVETAAE